MRIRRPEIGTPAGARRSFSRLISGAAMLCLTFLQLPLAAQWQTNGGTIYYNGGNVGIGTTGPWTKLVVAGSRGSIFLDTDFVVPGYLRIEGDVSGNFDINNTASNGMTRLYGYSGVQLRTASADPALTVLGSGSVGIGTTNPQHLLHVAGTIGAEEVIVSSTGADYVFQPGYRLRPLSEVAAYVNENHHLPDIPSAQDAKEKGVSVGEMQTNLLAKIEELTLHMIKADERNSRLEKQNQDLRDRIARLEAQAAH